jgi:clan AA aspartic protease (TIGR02281 family)
VLDKLLPGAPNGRVLAEAALASTPEAPPPAPAPLPAPAGQGGDDAHDHVVLPYEGSGNALHVPVEIEGPSGEVVEVTMIFDTGASFTTLDTATLRRLGLRVPADAPEVRVHTAAGERSSRLVLVPRVWIGGLQVEGVTVGVCDDCANGIDVGLLGLNVSGRFLTTVDQARREIVLRPRQGPDDRLADVRYWVELGAEATRWPDGQVEARVRVENRSARDILGATVELRAPDGSTVAGIIRAVSPGIDPKTRVALIYADLPAPGALRAGMFAEGRLTVGRAEVSVVPRESVVFRDGYPFVFVLGEGDRVTQRRIEAGAAEGDLLEVRSGLAPGDRVVVRGAGFLGDRDLVKIVDGAGS